MAAAAAPLVLVVDDVADTRRLMRRVLERAAELQRLVLIPRH